MLAIPNTTTTAAYTDAGAAVFPSEAGASTPYVSGFLFVANAAAFVSLLKGRGQGAVGWTPEALVSPTLIPLGTDLNARTPDFIFGVRARDGVAGTHAQVFGALFQQGEANFTPSGQFSGTVSGTGAFTQPTMTVPTGSILLYGGVTAPTGFLLCDGSAVSRTTFATLFGIIGTLYGAGDGATTFNVPDFRGRGGVGLGTAASVNALGANEGVALANRRPQHRHTVTDPGHAHFPDTDANGGDPWAGGGGTAALGGHNVIPAGGGHLGTTGITVGTATDSLDAPAYLVANYVIAT